MYHALQVKSCNHERTEKQKNTNDPQYFTLSSQISPRPFLMQHITRKRVSHDVNQYKLSMMVVVVFAS